MATPPPPLLPPPQDLVLFVLGRNALAGLRAQGCALRKFRRASRLLDSQYP
jgi:hypothetical protein